MSDTQHPKKEKKAAGVPPWMGGSARVGTTTIGGGMGSGAGSTAFLRGAATIGRNTGFFTKMSAALATPKMIAAMTVAGGLALGGGVAMNMGDGGSRRAAPRAASTGGQSSASPDSSAAGALPGTGPEKASALSLAQQANDGQLGVVGEVDEAADAASDNSEWGDEWAGEETDENAGAAEASGEGGAAAAAPEELAEELTKGRKAKTGLGEGKFGKLSGLSGIGGGGGGTSASLAAGQLGKMGGGSRTADVSRGRGATATGRGKKSARTKTMGASDSMARLRDMSGAMGGAKKNPEMASAGNTAAWEGQSPTGSALQGTGTGGIGDDGQAAGGGGTSNGSPTSDSGGATQSCPSGWTGSPPNCNPPSAETAGGGGMNITPYQFMVDLATLLLSIAAVIMLAISLSKWIPMFGVGVATMLLQLVVGIGAIVALMGMGIMMMGQSGQGALFTGLGSLTAIFAYAALSSVAGEASAKFEATTMQAAMGFSATAMAALGAGLGATQGRHTAFDDNGDD